MYNSLFGFILLRKKELRFAGLNVYNKHMGEISGTFNLYVTFL